MTLPHPELVGRIWQELTHVVASCTALTIPDEFLGAWRNAKILKKTSMDNPRPKKHQPSISTHGRRMKLNQVAIVSQRWVQEPTARVRFLRDRNEHLHCKVEWSSLERGTSSSPHLASWFSHEKVLKTEGLYEIQPRQPFDMNPRHIIPIVWRTKLMQRFTTLFREI